MTDLAVEDILKATGGTALSIGARSFSGVSIDSRSLGAGDLFVALKGSNADGHDYITSALSQAAGALVSRQDCSAAEGKTVIRVGDTLSALQQTARFLRSKRGIPVIAVTGTNGKTTTKELTASILGATRKVVRTTGNLNNHIGLPLCITRMDGNEDVMVLEMGSNAAGDIRVLCDIARPDIAVMTNVGPAHLEGFGSLESVRNTDLEVLEYVRTFVVNADDRFLMEGLGQYDGRLLTYGIDTKADITARDILLHKTGAGFMLCLPDGQNIQIRMQLSGRFNIYNALAAAGVCFAFGAGPEEIRQGIERFTGVPMRLEIHELDGLLVISDLYNANPASMHEAVKELARLRSGRSIAVLGDMLELGAYAAPSHEALIRGLNEMKVDLLIAVGSEMHKAASAFAGGCYLSADSAEAGRTLVSIVRDGDTILFKGSRGMKLEKALAELEASLQSGSANAV